MDQYFTTLPKKMARSISENGKIQVITPPIGEWKDVIMKLEVDDMIKTINRLELWEWFRDEKPPEGEGYMFWGHKNVNAISNGLENNNHSGASFGMCMRQIQFIEGNGWEAWNERNC